MPSPIFYPLAGLHCVVCMIEYERIRKNIENWKKNAGKCGLVKIMQKVRSVYKNEVNSKINKICRAIESLQKNGIECSVPVYGSDFLEKVYSICLEEIEDKKIDEEEIMPRFKGDPLFKSLKKEREQYRKWLFDREISMEKNIELLLDMIIEDKTPSGRSIYDKLDYKINYTKDDYIDDITSGLMMYLEEIEYGKISEYDNYYFKENREIGPISYCTLGDPFPLRLWYGSNLHINNKYISYKKLTEMKIHRQDE